MLKLVIDAARAARVSLSICGDMAGDPSLTWIPRGARAAGAVDGPDRLPPAKAVVRGLPLAEAEDLVRRASTLDSAVEIAELLRTRIVIASPRRLPAPRRYPGLA